MKKLRFKSLTMRIWTIFTIVILIIICSISVLYVVAYKRIDEKAKIHDLKVSHDIILTYSKNFEQSNKFDEFRNLKGSSNFILKLSGNNIPQITDLNGKNPPPMQDGKQQSMEEKTPPPGMNDMAVKMWMASFIKSSKVNDEQFKKTYNNMKFLFIISSVQTSSSEKTYLISYMRDLQDNNILYGVAGVGVLFIALGFIASKIAASRISKPLKEIEEYTVKIAKKDWKDSIEVRSDDEIGRLADSMNHMQKELKRADEEEKMFLQSISHDLKTPVMVIISHAEAIIDGIYVGSIEKNAEIIRDEAINLNKKIKEMLYLNTLDYVLENSRESDEIDLRSMVLYIINRFEMINSKIEWNLDIDEILIKGDKEKIQVSIENILDNALRYAKEKICISLKKEGSFAVLEIYNDGPHIPKEHINNVFDKMYKDKTGNFGLGLAISKKIINFYGGEIKAENKEDGVSFTIKLRA